MKSHFAKCVALGLLCCVATKIVRAQSFDFSTLAGNAGYGSVDGLGVDARFDFPTGIAVDSSGVIYVADTQNSTIRKIDVSAQVETLAGLAGNVGATNGNGTVARFKYPQGIATDTAGNIYVADTGNSTIRRITASGDVSTIAGSPGVVGSSNGVNSAASFGLPCGLALDASGNIYVADTYNSIIRQIASVGTNWLVTTVAGSPGIRGAADGTNANARFYQPLGIVVGNDGNIYVADTGNNSVRKIARFGTDWMTTTLTNVNLPGGIAADTAGNLFVADSANNVIRKLALSGSNWVVSIFAGSPGSFGSADGTTGARFNFPRGVAMAANGNLFVADSLNNTIRQITSAGAVSTVAGTAGGPGSTDGTLSQASFDAPLGIAVDSVRNVYIADSHNNTIRRISPLGLVTTLAGSATNLPGSMDGTNATFNLPSALAIDDNTNIYIADFNNNEIRKLSPAGASWTVTTLAGRAGSVFYGTITNFGGIITNTFGSLTNLASIVFSTTPRYTNFSGVLTNINKGTTNFTFIVTNTPVLTNIVRGQTNVVALASNLFVLPILKVSTVYWGNATFKNYSGTVTNIAGGVTNLTVVVTNVPFLTNVLNGHTQIVSLSTNFFNLPRAPQSLDGIGTDALFYHPSGLALDTSGNLYVADGGTNGIRLINPAGAVTTLPGSLGQYTVTNQSGIDVRFYSSSAIALDQTGNIYVTDTDNNTIRKITPEGSVMTIAGAPGYYGTADGANAVARFASPVSIAVDAQANLYVADGLNHTLRKVVLSGTNWVVSTLSGQAGIRGNLDGPDQIARFNNPSGIALDSSGNLYVADTDNNTIRFGQRVASSGPVTLQISQLNGQVKIRWPSSATDFVLETKSGIGPENPWNPVTSTPVVSGSDLVVTVEANGGTAYYRLRKP